MAKPLKLHNVNMESNKAHMKPPNPSYFINFGCLYQLCGIIDSVSVGVERFSQVVMIFVINSHTCILFVGL